MHVPHMHEGIIARPVDGKSVTPHATANRNAFYSRSFLPSFQRYVFEENDVLRRPVDSRRVRIVNGPVKIRIQWPGRVSFNDHGQMVTRVYGQK